MCRPQEDLIDFPCAPEWLCDYFHQGLTPRHPPECYYVPRGRGTDSVSSEILDLVDALRGFEERMTALIAELTRLVAEVRRARRAKPSRSRDELPSLPILPTLEEDEV